MLGESMAADHHDSPSGPPEASTEPPPAGPPSLAGECLHSELPEDAEKRVSGEFQGWGKVVRIKDVAPPRADLQRKGSHGLGQVLATAICGNDITSSCLYVAALCAIYAGPYAFLCLAGVAAVLYVFRGIYAEVGSAMPLNGGAYNALLNTTSKPKASTAACLTILSYLATAVISGSEAIHYLDHMLSGLPIIGATIGLLGFFAVLSIVGITESATVALIIFVLHLGTLTVLVVASFAHFDVEVLVANWKVGPPSGSLGHALLFGFASGLLGISGFESSANFIEEQKRGVFPKTLRNMWLTVAILNPLISFLAMSVMPLSDAWVVLDGEKQPRPDFLAHMGAVTGGTWLARAVSIDAVLVLSGAVLTSFVGVTGLVRRMALDRCLPQFLLAENRLRRTNHWIILGFFGLCCSVIFITSGRISVLAGVYTLSFLSVMALFAVGNMLLKVKRARLRRETHAAWPAVLIGFVAACVGLFANALIDYPRLERLRVFIVYFVVAVGVVALTFQRAAILRLLLAAFRAVITPISSALARKLDEINNQAVVFFSRGDNLANLNRAALYVLQNEQTKRLKVVHVYEREDDVDNVKLADHLRTVDELYPELRIDLVLVQGKFGPDLIEELSKRLGVPKNYMFLGTPGDRFPHNIAELGGVRLII
jgi:amino acid transporter